MTVPGLPAHAAAMVGLDGTFRILAVIPAYNAGRSVGAVVHAALAYLPVLVVDDGSTDDTAAQAAAAGAEVLRQQPNQGKGTALQAGFRRALELGCEAVVTLDADLQHDPQEIPAFVQAWKARHANLVIGRRNFAEMPAVRRISNTLGTWIFSRAVGHPIPDNQSGYRLISRRLMEASLAPAERGYEFEVEMITACIVLGWPIDSVPIRTIYGEETSHIQPLKHGYKFIQVSMRARRKVRAARKI